MNDDKLNIHYEAGREQDPMSKMCEEFYRAVHEYNKQNPDNNCRVMLLAVDKNGGSSFIYSEHVEDIVSELLDCATRSKHFRDFVRSLLDTVDVLNNTFGKCND